MEEVRRHYPDLSEPYGERHEAEGLARIPLADASAALQFCRTLALSLDACAETADGSAARAGEPRPVLSVVIPVLQEEENLPALYRRLTDVMRQLSTAYEIIFVDDGS